MLVSRKHKQLVLNLKNPDRITAVIPTARTMQYKGRTLVAVPHKVEEVRVLRNLGISTPAPMEYHYKWPGRFPPFQHQRVTADFLATNPRAFCLNGMGSGKTMSVLWAFDYLRRAGVVDWMLVVSPLSTLERAWGDEIFKHFPETTFAVVHGPRPKRLKLIAQPHDIYVINHDGVKDGLDGRGARPGSTLHALATKPGRGLIVIDEIAVARNSQTATWKALNLLINGNEKRGFAPREWAWGLTGTPMPNEPTDAWAQCRLINPSRVPQFVTGFRDTVMRQITQFKWVAREGALETVYDAMQPAIRYSREECIDLPPTTVSTRQVDLTKEQQAAFDEMLRQFHAEYEGGQITAANEAIKMSKLLQICAGVAYGNDDTHVVLPSGPRIELVREIIEQAQAKVLVFVPFTAPLMGLAAALEKTHTVAVVHGGVTKTQRDKIFQDFQSGRNPQVIVADARTMAHGLTLVEANTVVWYAPPNSAETYQQACARVTRPGQTKNTYIINIESTAIERKVYERLNGKEKLQGLLLGMMKN